MEFLGEALDEILRRRESAERGDFRQWPARGQEESLRLLKSHIGDLVLHGRAKFRPEDLVDLRVREADVLVDIRC